MNSNASMFCPEDLAADRELADISESFRFLLDVTPVNVESARHRFLTSQHSAPSFEYRDLEDDPAVIGKRLDAVAVEAIVDPTLSHLLQAKRREIELQLALLRARGTDDFMALSIDLYGTVTSGLFEVARGLLDDIPPPRPATRARWCDASALARLAEAELGYYRRLMPDLAAHVEIRDDCSSVMVANGDLLIPASLRIAKRRVEALLQHEVGTHIVTYVNGSCQPLRTLGSGLAGYEETQEGLAVLAEYLIGRLSSSRLRQLAARVVAVHAMVSGQSFRTVHEQLVDAAFSSTEAFAITMRVYRSGGLTKDAIYLRGLNDLIGYLGAGHSMDVFWLGKMALSAAPLIEELWRRGALVEPRIRPRYLNDPGTEARITSIQGVTSLGDLVERAA